MVDASPTSDTSNADDAAAIDAPPDATPDASGLCSEGDARTELAGACYSRFNTPRTYMEAAAACAAFDAHLVSLRTQNEADLIPLLATTSTWIGLSDRDSPGTYVWQTGETLAALRWPSGEPSGDGDCVQAFANGNWDDTDCSTPKPYICERSLAVPPCVEGDAHTEYNGHCYFRISINGTYAEAVDRCLAQNAHLPVITSQAENDAVLSIWTAWSWIGLRDLPAPGTFEWDTGEPLGYTNWEPGEPNSIGFEQCAHLWGGGTWNNSTCDYTMAETLCERP